MARRTRIGAAVAIAIAAAASAAPAWGTLRPMHYRTGLEHVIHQKQKELQRVQTRARKLYEGWQRGLAHHEQQKQNLLARFEARAAACEGAAEACGAARTGHLSEETQRLNGEIQADQSLASMPAPGEAPAAKHALERARVLEEGIKQREAELAALPSRPQHARRAAKH